MSDRTMDLIRGANPYPEGLPPLPIEAVIQRLAENEPRRPPDRPRIRLPDVGGMITAVAALVALVIAVVAITTLGHRPRATVAPSSPVASSRHELLQILGILRRPQNRTDRSAIRPGGDGGELPGVFRVTALGAASRPPCPMGSRALPCTMRLDTPLVRAVNVGGGYRAAIFPTKIEHSSAQAQRGEGVVIALRGALPFSFFIASPTPTSVQALRSHGLLLSDYVASGVDRGVMLVPDGVAELTLDHFQLLAPHAARLSQIPPTTSTVTDNFALLQITGLTEQNLHLNPHTLGPYYHDASGQGCRTTFVIYSLPATARMTWLSPEHTPIRRITINLRLDVATHHPAAGTFPVGPAARAACQAN
jgi:hypothetical protein